MSPQQPVSRLGYMRMLGPRWRCSLPPSFLRIPHRLIQDPWLTVVC